MICQAETLERARQRPQYGDTFEVMDVKDRSHILFHWGNWVTNTRGCILVGEKFGKINDEPAIFNSMDTFNKLLVALTDVSKFNITIQGANNAS